MKWYHIKDDLSISIQNVALCSRIVLSPQGPHLWCIRFEYAHPEQDKETACKDFDVMKMLHDKIYEWLADSDRPVFKHDEELEKCLQEIRRHNRCAR